MAKATKTKTQPAAPKRRRKRIPLSDRKYIQQLTLMDNEFMTACLNHDIPATQEMLRVILKREDLVVKSVETQQHFKGVKRSIYVDIFAIDGEGRPINVEIENSTKGADPRRARFHSAVIDTHSLEMGQDFDKLPDHYIIFITAEDVLGLGKMLYTIHRIIDGEGIPFNDGSHIIYVNTSAEDDGSELAKLIHDLRCPDPDKMYFPNLAARIKFLKQTEEGVEQMSGVVEKIRRDAEEKAEKKAAKQIKAVEKKAAQQVALATKQAEQATRRIEQAEEEKENFVLGLLKLGKLTMQEIADCSGLSVARIRKLAQSLA